MKSRYYIIVAVVLAAGAIWVARSHATEAQKHAAAIVALDVTSEDTTAARLELQRFVGAHMGTSASVTLQTSYDRDAAAAQASAAGGVSQGQVYAQAQQACSGKSSSIIQAKCVADYVGSHSTPGSQPQAVATPKLSDYQYRYMAPIWTPDLAGGLWLGAIVALFFGGIVWLAKRRA